MLISHVHGRKEREFAERLALGLQLPLCFGKHEDGCCWLAEQPAAVRPKRSRLPMNDNPFSYHDTFGAFVVLDGND